MEWAIFYNYVPSWTYVMQLEVLPDFIEITCKSSPKTSCVVVPLAEITVLALNQRSQALKIG